MRVTGLAVAAAGLEKTRSLWNHPLPVSTQSAAETEIASRARKAIAATLAVYLLFGLFGLHPWLRAVRGLLLVAAFYFLPMWMLRDQPRVQARYEVGPDSPIPEWRWRGLKVAGIACLVIFPPFVLGFWWFYSQVCNGDLSVLAPVTYLEGLTPWAGGLETYLAKLCRTHDGGLWPEHIRVPATWTAYYGLGWLYELAIGLFAVAMAEEVFHRGYLMSALEDRWPPKHRIFGVPFGLAAVISSLMFAGGHLLAMAQVGRLATFFPALVFAWLWRRSGSLWAPALFHTAANALMDVLLSTTFPVR